MFLMPISSLPMPSDDNSQAQVLRERKSELSNESQVVEQSNMRDQDKTSALDDINRKMSQADADIEKKESSQAHKQHMKTEKATDDQQKASEKKKQLLDKSKRLDITA